MEIIRYDMTDQFLREQKRWNISSQDESKYGLQTAYSNIFANYDQ